MVDKEGYRPNVGIIVCNNRNKVLWAKRSGQNSWQFPQGGIKKGETPKEALFRELKEEVGLLSKHVKILGRTKDWLKYDVPKYLLKNQNNKSYKGQKQIWFIMRFIGNDNDVSLQTSNKPEFDSWRWNDYWVPSSSVIKFKRDVYKSALEELSVFIK